MRPYIGIALTCAFFAAGCNAHFGSSVTSSHDLHDTARQTFATSATPHVSVDNVSGNITVTGWNQPRVQIDIVKYGAVQSDLANTEIVIDHSDTDVSIKTQYPSQVHARGGEVYYTLHIPSGSQLSLENVSGAESVTGVTGKLDAHTVSGKISADSLTTDAKAETTSGAVELAFAKAPQNGAITAKTVSGRVSVTVPANISARVDASSVSGGFTSDFPDVHAKKQDVGSKASGTIGSGGTTINMETVSGAIELRKK